MLREYLSNIAGAIRSKLGTSDKVNAQDFADKVNEVYDKGKDDFLVALWDGIQAQGRRRNYSTAFNYEDYSYFNEAKKQMWNDETFRPIYDIRTNTLNRFMRGSGVADFKKIMNEQGVVLDTSLITSGDQLGLAFRFCGWLLNMTEINLSNITNTVFATEMFADCYVLHTIDKFKLPTHGNTLFSDTFARCNKLENINFEGVIGGSINFSWSPLSIESMKSIISCLKNHAGTTKEATQTLSFTETCWANLEASGKPFDDGLTDDANLSWRDYVMDSLGWLT